jgi:phenylacetate-CoA ligase
MLVARFGWSLYLGYHLRNQRKIPFKPISEIRMLQSKRLQHMIKHAYDTVPYYKDTLTGLGLKPNDFKCVEDLSKLPLLGREQLQQDPDYFLSTGQSPESYLKLRSGGSTGAPRTVYHNAGALFQNAAHGERERSIFTRLVEKSLGYRETVIASPLSTAAKVQNFCRNHGFFPRKAQIERQYLSLLDEPKKNLELLNDFRPDIIQCYGSYLDNLIIYVLSKGAHFNRPKLITYSSDGLSETTRELIEEEFQIPVFSTYQAVEVFKIGFECESHQGLHLNIDLYPIRIVDQAGQTLPAGESGDVVVSNLVNRATVLLNYRLGDIAQIFPEKCFCGRTLPLLSFLQGRSDDWIELTNGKTIHPQAIRTIFTNETGILQYQVIQRDRTHFEILLVAIGNCNRAGVKELVKDKFMRLFGQNVFCDIAYVNSIAKTMGGKHRPVISFKGKPQIKHAGSLK